MSAGSILAALALTCVTARGLDAQVLADPVLNGRAYVGDSAMSMGTVVLHHLAEDEQGEVDSVAVSADGSFSFRLPGVPDPRRTDIYFASVRHQGVLYFGGAVSRPVQLDSLYQIQAYDTAMVSGGLAPLRMGARNVFMEQGDSASWRVTDLFQVLNESDRTFVAGAGEVVWSYPVPAEARELTIGPSDLMSGGAGFDGGRFVVTSPIPPGERLFVLRYVVDDPFLEIPTQGPTSVLEVLVREPAPPIEVSPLSPVTSVELESGSTYRRFVGEDVAEGVVGITEGEVVRPPPVRWMAVILALVLGGTAAVVVGRSRGGVMAGAGADDGSGREALLMEIARLDDAFEAFGGPTEAQVREYRRRRTALLRRLRNAG